MDGVVFRNALDTLLDETGRNRSEEAQEAWTGLVQLIENTCQSQEDLALVASNLLSTDASLLSFIAGSLEQQGTCFAFAVAECMSRSQTGRVALLLNAGKAGSKTREAVYKYLDTFLRELGANKAQKYCSNVIQTCMFAFKREESNPAKAATFLPLQCILDWQLPDPTFLLKMVGELVKTYQGAYQRVKSLTATVKGDILQTLGSLLDVQAQVTYPLVTVTKPIMLTSLYTSYKRVQLF